MRVATANAFNATVDNLQRRQADMSRAQEQLTSGKRVSVPSDDPTAAARAERAYIAQQRITSNQRSVDLSRSAMTLAESALGQIGDVLQSARETLVAAGNGTYGKDERAALAGQLKQLRAQLLSQANQTDSAGGYVFGGQGATSAPFLDGPGGVTANPSMAPGQTVLSASEQMPTTVDGQALWLQTPSGNGVFTTGASATNSGSGWIDAGGVTDPAALTGDPYSVEFSVTGGVTTFSVLRAGAATALSGVPYTPGQAVSIDGMSFHLSGTPADLDTFTITPSTSDLDPFDALDRAIAVLNNPSANSGQVQQVVSSGLRDIDAIANRMGAARSAAGSTLSRLDEMDSRNQDRQVWAKSVQSDAEDLDMVQAVSDFQNQQTSYQAALQSYAVMHRMSLFDYLK